MTQGPISVPATTPGLLRLASEGLEELVAVRRDLHAHPELGFEEVRTSALVAAKLAEWGVTDVTPLGGTGLVATVRGSRPGGRAVGLRADMDALALEEANGFDYSSTHPGKMHACGHDGHTTMLLGAARLLASNSDFAGTVHLIFQPAEEGRGGAAKMLEEGLFDKFHCDRIFGMHSAPQMAVGEFGTTTGPMMAASGRWTVTFLGSGGHGGAGPHLTQDLTVVAASYIQALQSVVARNVSAF
ncbi:MAG: amidohydrolase, partial [Trueperaceae bacterium]